jgi:osmotically-inducible protein OsmY
LTATLACTLLPLTACERKSPSPAPIAAKPDNTASNAVDRGGKTITPADQAQNANDVRITADIRKAIMGDSSMSVNAQNVKIVTDNGIVTLRGVVDSQAEKDSIEQKAAAVPGVTRVTNMLSIKT